MNFTKSFSGDFQSPEGVLAKLTNNICELSSEKKALCTLRKKTVPVYVTEESEFEREEIVEADNIVETNFARRGRKMSEHVGRGRPVFQRGRVFRGRGVRHDSTTTSSEGGRGFVRGNQRAQRARESFRYRVRGGRGTIPYVMEGRNTVSTTSNNVVCHNCQKSGHLARNCFNVKCFNCRELGHLAKDYKAPKSFLWRCCGNQNHTSNNCTALVEEINEWKMDGIFF